MVLTMPAQVIAKLSVQKKKKKKKKIRKTRKTVFKILSATLRIHW